MSHVYFSSAVCWKENHCIILQANLEENPTVDKEIHLVKFMSIFSNMNKAQTMLWIPCAIV